MQLKLTEDLVKALDHDSAGGKRVYDLGCPGLSIYIGKRVKRWTLDYGDRDRRRRITIGTWDAMSVKNARKEAGQILNDVLKGNDPLDDRRERRAELRLKDWTAKYIEAVEADGRQGEMTLRETRRHMKRADEMLGHKKLSAITAGDIERYRNAQGDKGRVANGNRALVAIRACLGEAWRKGFVPSNEALKVRRVAGEQPRQRIFSQEEMKALLDAIEAHEDHTFKVGMIIMVETGCRRSELLRARWDDIDLDSAEWTIPKPKNRIPTIKALTVRAVEALASLPRDSVFVLGHWSEILPTGFSQAFRKMADGVGLTDLKLHDVRRTMGALATKEFGLEVAARILGHADLATTYRTYSPWATKDLGERVEALSQERGKVLEFPDKAEREGDS